MSHPLQTHSMFHPCIQQHMDFLCFLTFLSHARRLIFGTEILIRANIKALNDCVLVISTPHTHTHTRLMALCPGLPRWAGTTKVKPIWILQEQETVSGSGISWAICKSAPRSRQITTPVLHRSVFLQAGCPSCCPTNELQHWRHMISTSFNIKQKTTSNSTA